MFFWYINSHCQILQTWETLIEHIYSGRSSRLAPSVLLRALDNPQYLRAVTSEQVVIGWCGAVPYRNYVKTREKPEENHGKMEVSTRTGNDQDQTTYLSWRSALSWWLMILWMTMDDYGWWLMGVPKWHFVSTEHCQIHGPLFATDMSSSNTVMVMIDDYG